MPPRCGLCSTPRSERGLSRKAATSSSWTVPRSEQGAAPDIRRGHSHPTVPNHKARNVADRLAPKHRAAMRRAPKQAWESNEADKAERSIRNLARRFEQEAPDVSRSILEGLDEIPPAVRLGMPPEPRRSPASTDIVEAVNHEPCRRGGLPQCEAMEERQNGVALDRCWNARSQKGGPTHRGPRAIPYSQAGPRRPPPKRQTRPREGRRIPSHRAAPITPVSTSAGTSPPFHSPCDTKARTKTPCAKPAIRLPIRVPTSTERSLRFCRRVVGRPANYRHSPNALRRRPVRPRHPGLGSLY